MIRSGLSSACLYPTPTEDAVAYLTQNGVKHLEVFFNASSELKKTFTDSLPLEGVTVEAVHPFTSIMEPLLFFSAYERRLDDAIDLYKAYFEAAQNLNCHKLVLHGDRAERFCVSDEEYFERIAKIREAAKPYGVEVLQENLTIFRCRTPDFVRRMRAYLHDDIGFVFDLKQAVRSGADPFEMLDAMGSCLKHVHISDNDPTHDCLVVGQGTFDYAPFMKKLREIGYDGAILMEVYRENYRDPEELFEGLRVLKNIVKSY